jgi:hypothetical protein
VQGGTGPQRGHGLKTITLDNIHSDIAGYQKLITLNAQAKPLWFDTLDVQIERWFDANLAAALGGILDETEADMNTVRIDHIDEAVKKILQKNGFLAHFGYPSVPDTNNTTIKYLKLKPTDTRFFHQYVLNELLDRSELPSLTDDLKKKMAESIYEIFVNAQIHSQSAHIYTCGQYFPAKSCLTFTIADTGIGFKNTVRRRFNREIPAEKAILWATTAGHTTKTDISGGIGLAILKEFIVQNKGSLQIISNDGYYQLGINGENSGRFTAEFPGTIVTMKFNTNDTSSYGIIDGNLSGDLF